MFEDDDDDVESFKYDDYAVFFCGDRSCAHEQ